MLSSGECIISMKKGEIFDLFGQKISKKAIIRQNDEYVVSGRNTLVQFHEKLIDVWIFNTNGNRLNRMLMLADLYDIVDWHRWEGECAVQTYDPEFVTDNLKFLHIRRKRVVPEGYVPGFMRI